MPVYVHDTGSVRMTIVKGVVSIIVAFFYISGIAMTIDSISPSKLMAGKSDVKQMADAGDVRFKVRRRQQRQYSCHLHVYWRSLHTWRWRRPVHASYRTPCSRSTPS